MKVAIDTTPTLTGHASRGIGVYTRNLIEELRNNKAVELITFDNPKKPPSSDLIHYPYFDLFFNTLPIFKKTPRVITIHDVIPLVYPQHFPCGLKGKLNLTLQKVSLKNSQAVICDSETSKKDIASRLSFPENKIHVVYLAPSKIFKKIIDKKLLIKTKEKYKLPDNFLLYVGDVNWNKNLLNLLRAVKLSKKNIVLVGKALTNTHLPQVEEINNLIRELNIEKQVNIIGYITDEDLASVYNLADLTLAPSYYEGFGLPVVESMAAGTPVICAKNSSLQEVGGEAAIYCDPANPKDIADKINNFIALNRQSKEAIGEHCIMQSSKFSWENTGKKVYEIYKKYSK